MHKQILSKLGLCHSPGISGENFSRSEYVDVSAIFQFAFPPLVKGVPSWLPICK